MTMVMKRNAIGQCYWPDNDIVIVGRELVEEKKAKKVKSGGSVINEIGGIGVGIARNNLVERMFSCREPGCEYEIKIVDSSSFPPGRSQGRCDARPGFNRYSASSTAW